MGGVCVHVLYFLTS